jgi:hypothetical protein
MNEISRDRERARRGDAEIFTASLYHALTES